jgi:acetylornithine deacetylase/succinyl-diaminopimelate desuccinylase-like protein
MDPSIIERVLNLAVKIQQIPAPTFEERQRATFIYRYFLDIGANNVFLDEIGNVYAHINGIGEKPPLVVSAHLDTVFPADTDLSISHTQEKITGPGIGDNSLGLAGLFGLYWALSDGNVGKNINPTLAGDVQMWVKRGLVI